MIYHPTNQRLYVGGEDETPKIITNTDATPLKKAPPVQENLLYVPSNNWEKKFKEDLFQNETDYKFVYEDSLGSEFKDSRIHVVEGGFNIQVNNNPIGWGSWDICAGHAILSCFGGVMTDFQGNDIDYSKSILKTGFITADSIERINNLPWIKGYSKK
jgi:3'-phosphoadenosine 5'-phosphosulfate (PAPS) 3'-phosphatase